MAKRPKKQKAGVPEWVVTYGDMMSLLLTFFILLAAFSELKREREYQEVITAVKEAFGYSGGVGVMPTREPPLRSMIQSLEELAKKELKETKVSQSVDPGIDGRRTKVTRVDEGLMFTIGGGLSFEPASAELLPGAKEELAKVARLLRGRRNKIVLRGHAASKSLPAASRFDDLWDLSYARAKAVKEFMVQEGGLSERVIVLEARGDTEPVAPRAYTPRAQSENRRVEVIMTEAMVDDFHPDPNYSREDLARDG